MAIPIIYEDAGCVTFHFWLNHVLHVHSIAKNEKSLAAFPNITGIYLKKREKME